MSAAKESPPPVLRRPLADALSERYLSYALSTIMSRSLPDVRDGLKPVQRRILYAMHELRLNPEGGYKKAARVVGDVIGKYHPHGDSAVYDALVRQAQDFASRYPLVDGQGNFGNIDGDNAAAMRYTEARLTDVAMALLQDIDKDTVDFLATYDGEEREPKVLPAAFPNLLANGTTGIAVGMATSIPPHNVAELCDAALHLIKSPSARVDTLLEKVKGPDFPTGGLLINDPEALKQIYDTGRGSLTVRSKWEVEQLSHGQYRIVITEIPYQVQKSNLIEKTAELMVAKKLPLIADIIDESAEDIRIVIEPKTKNLDSEVVMALLFKHTDFQTRVSFNLNLLDKDQVPRVMGLREILQSWLDHRREVLVRRSEFRLHQIAHRLEVLSGYLIVFANLDEVIQILRTEDEPKPVLQKRFSLSDVQVEAILNMRLRALRKLEEARLREEYEALQSEESKLKALLADESEQWSQIADEVRETKKLFGDKSEYGARRTQLMAAPKEIDFDETPLVDKEPVTILCSEQGWIRVAKGHGHAPDAFKHKEGDAARFLVEVQTTDRLSLFTSLGKFYTLDAHSLPSARGFGEPVSLMVDLKKDEEIVALFAYEPKARLLLVASDGRGFVLEAENSMAQTRSGRQALNVGAGAEAAICRVLRAEDDTVASLSKKGKLLMFPLEEISTLNRGRGVILQRYKDGDALAGLTTFQRAASTGSPDHRYAQHAESYSAGRGTQGKKAPRSFKI